MNAPGQAGDGRRACDGAEYTTVCFRRCGWRVSACAWLCGILTSNVCFCVMNRWLWESSSPLCSLSASQSTTRLTVSGSGPRNFCSLRPSLCCLAKQVEAGGVHVDGGESERRGSSYSMQLLSSKEKVEIHLVDKVVGWPRGERGWVCLCDSLFLLILSPPSSSLSSPLPSSLLLLPPPCSWCMKVLPSNEASTWEC